jgi:ATP-dependent protease HslVU (ClpYQ) peptidase subunit
MDAGGLALEAMRIAAGICIYTNDAITVETL